MTPRGRLPSSWGSAPPDKLAGCTVAVLKFITIGVMLFGAGDLIAWLLG